MRESERSGARSARSWAVFAGAVLVYLVTIAQRTSFGIAGVEATERFAVTAAVLSTIGVVQIATYAALQIPVGVLVDRLGPRFMLLVGSAGMALGQLVLAVATEVGVALVARILVGAGDAFIFVSVIRLLPNWFSGRILPQLSQAVGMIGQCGQFVSAIPFALVLHSLGWQPAFLSMAALCLLAVAVAAAVVRNGAPPASGGPEPTGSTWSRLRASIARPGTLLGFWVHLLGGTWLNCVGLLWGYPFLTAALGYDVAAASSVMSLLILAAVLGAPLTGWVVTRLPYRRVEFALLLTLLTALSWASVLLWPGEPPVVLVGALFFLVGLGAPSSLIGMDYARAYNPAHSVGSASGFINAGGFSGGFTAMLLVGIVLDIVDAVRTAQGSASQLYALDSFRLAFLAAFLVPIVGVVATLLTRRALRRTPEGVQGI